MLKLGKVTDYGVMLLSYFAYTAEKQPFSARYISEKSCVANIRPRRSHTTKWASAAASLTGSGAQRYGWGLGELAVDA